MFVSFNSNMMYATNGAGAAYTSGGPEFTPFFCEVCVAQSVFLRAVFYR